jgi:hypothetical protein
MTSDILRDSVVKSVVMVPVIIRDAPDIRLDNPAFFISSIRPETRLPAGYPARYPVRLDTGYPAGYPANV